MCCGVVCPCFMWRLRCSVRYSAIDYLACYILHQAEQSATHKFVLASTGGRSILVECAMNFY
jgi:hypothetical protein